MATHVLSGPGDGEQLRVDLLSARDLLSDAGGCDRVAHALPVDERDGEVDPPRHGVGGVVAAAGKGRKEPPLGLEAVHGALFDRFVGPAIHPGGQPRRRQSVELCDRGRRAEHGELFEERRLEAAPGSSHAPTSPSSTAKAPHKIAFDSVEDPLTGALLQVRRYA